MDSLIGFEDVWHFDKTWARWDLGALTARIMHHVKTLVEN